jgi:hypothetical protein
MNRLYLALASLLAITNPCRSKPSLIPNSITHSVDAISNSSKITLPVYSLGVFTTDNVKIHFSDIFHLTNAHSTHYLSFLFGHTKSWIADFIIGEPESFLLIQRNPAPDPDAHCAELNKFGSSRLITQIDGLPNLAIGPSGHLQLGVGLIKTNEHSIETNNRLLIATAFDNAILFSSEGVVASYWSVVTWESCTEFFQSSRPLLIGVTSSGGLNASDYAHRWEPINNIYDFNFESRVLLLIYTVITLGALLSAGTWIILYKWLKKDVDIMSNKKVKLEMGLWGTQVLWKRIQKDVFRPPTCRFLFISLISNGTFLLVSVSLGLIIACIRHLMTRTVEIDLFLLTGVILIGSVSQGIAMETLRRELKFIGKQARRWNEHSCLLKGVVALFLRLPLLLGALCILCTHFTKWHVMEDSETLYTYSQRVVLPTISLLSICTLAIGAGSAFPFKLNTPLQTRNPQRVFLLEEVGGSIIPKAHPSHTKRIFVLSVIVPFLIIVPPLWIHFGVLFGNLWIGIAHLKLIGLTACTFLISWISFATSNLNTCYSLLHRGDYHWWWKTVYYNSLAASFVVLFLLFFLPFSTAETLPFTLTLFVCFAALLSTIGFYSQYAFIRYIYLTLKPD